MTDSQSMPTHKRFQDLTGRQFEKLTVVSFAGFSSNRREATWMCQCECGSAARSFVGRNLICGNSKSCGECVLYISPDEYDSVLRNRLLSSIVIAESGCWEWQKHINPISGYGYMSIGGGKQKTAHSVAYRLFIGEIPPGMIVCHTCDNRKCVYPLHLWPGTHKQNTADCIKKNRFAVGESLPQSKLTPHDVAEIREMIASSSLSYPEIAARSGVTPSLVCCIAKNKIWKHVTAE